jgi:uncharacterized protein (TIGR02646 family)
MRFVIKKDSDKTSKLQSPETYNKLLLICQKVDTSIISSNIYRDPYDDNKTAIPKNTESQGKRSHVEDQLNLSYFHKCSYCERKGKADIEHYRPKGSVRAVKHPGYYWLCYEWTNLIPSCINCNREGGKHDQFPIMGSRVLGPKFESTLKLDLNSHKVNSKLLMDEKPYLLHPEVDEPSEYFTFKFHKKNEGIVILGTDGKGRGKKTIEICLLNRQEVRLSRQEMVYDELVNSLHFKFNKYKNRVTSVFDDKKFWDSLEEKTEEFLAYSLCETSSHTLLRKHIAKNIDNFKSIVGPLLLDEVKDYVFSVAEGLIKK